MPTREPVKSGAHSDKTSADSNQDQGKVDSLACIVEDEGVVEQKWISSRQQPLFVLRLLLRWIEADLLRTCTLPNTPATPVSADTLLINQPRVSSTSTRGDGN